jgi:hypothetical protein
VRAIVFSPLQNVQIVSGVQTPSWIACNGLLRRVIKEMGCEPNNSPVSVAEVMMLITNFPFVLHFLLHEQQCSNSVRVFGTDMYGEQWASGSAD